MGSAVKTSDAMTLDEFFAVYDSVAEKYELVAGVSRLVPLATPDHSVIQSNALFGKLVTVIRFLRARSRSNSTSWPAFEPMARERSRHLVNCVRVDTEYS